MKSAERVIEKVLDERGVSTDIHGGHFVQALRDAGWHLLHVELHHETDHPEPASWGFEGLDVLEFKGQLDDVVLTARGTAHLAMLRAVRFDAQKTRTEELWRDFARLLGIQLGFVEPR